MNMLRLGITPEGQIGSHPDIIAKLRPQKCARATVVLAPSGPRHQSTLPRFMRSMLGSHCRLSVRAFIGFRRLDVLVPRRCSFGHGRRPVCVHSDINADGATFHP
jgi:hypothetical protein